MLCVRLMLRTVQKLQLTQSTAMKLPNVATHYEHITLVLKQLHCLLIHFWAQYKMLVLTLKVLNELGAGYLMAILLISIKII